MKFSFFHQSLIPIWVIGLVTAVFCFLTIEFYESRRLHAQLKTQFSSKVKSLEQSTAALSELLYSTHKFMQNGNNPTQEQFQNFLNDRTEIGSGINSVFWLPLTALSDVNQFKAQAEDDGLLGFQLFPDIQQTASCANWLEEATLPVYYVSPQFEASDYLGQRLDTNCNDATAMERALYQQEITTSIFNEDGIQGMRMFLPVMERDGKLQGFVVVSILLYEFLGVAWKSEINSKKLNISVLNLSEQTHTIVFQSHINVALKKTSGFERKISHTQEVTLPTIGQRWQISVSTIENKYSVLIYGSAAVVLILLLTASVSFGVAFYAHRLRVSEQLVKEKTRSLEIQATQDELTGLLNRKALSGQINFQRRQIETRQSVGFSILFIDLDRFKIVNDSMGHLIGDLVLKEVANRLKNSIRKEDICFRLGGDEFVVCLPNQVDKQVTRDLCQRFSNLLTKPYYIHGQTCHLGASIGVSIVTSSTQSLASILREADTAMYKAKESGAEKVIFFNENMFTAAKQRFVLEQDLIKAVKEEQLSLAFQPIYCQKKEQVSGFEALLRWNHPVKGLISPAEFIPVAEETGLIIQIGDWVVRQVCQTLEQLWQNHSLTHTPRININVSAKQFESKHIIRTLQDTLNIYQFPPHLLGIEITESFLLNHSPCTVKALEEIKKLGVIIYLDDFGTGYSSLSVLSEYPVDIVKMDRSFVRNIDHNAHKSAQLCQAIISMSHAISLDVVAEGVETEIQLATLHNYGCNFIQGFLKAKPVSKADMSQYLSYKPNE